MEQLQWSVVKFDSRMEDYIGNQRRKRKKRQRKQDEDAQEERDGGAEGDAVDLTGGGSAASKPKAQPRVRSYATGARISLKDQEGRAMAHGIVIDDEPALPDEDDIETDEDLKHCSVGDFKRIKLVRVVKGWGPTPLEKDTVYTSDWQLLGKQAARTLGALLGLNEEDTGGRDELEGFMCWHECIIPRLVSDPSAGKKKKKKK